MSGLPRVGQALLAVALVASQALVALALVAAIGTNSDTATTARDLAVGIQRERARSIRENCEAQNRRHDATIRRLDELIAKAPPTRKRRAVESRPGTILLIKELAPKRDCDELAKRQASLR